MKAEDLINNNLLTNILVEDEQSVVLKEIALTAINMARKEERTLTWISVEDELPEPGEEVILFEKNTIMPYQIGWRRNNQWHNKYIWVLQNGHVVSEVTHWMRIPKLS